MVTHFWHWTLTPNSCRWHLKISALLKHLTFFIVTVDSSVMLAIQNLCCHQHYSCADPGIFARWGGVQAWLSVNSSDVFLVLNLFYSFTEGVQWSFQLKKTIIFQGFRGGPTFSRGHPTFSRGGGVGGGSKCLFLQNPYNLWFSRRVWTPSPLWIRTCYLRIHFAKYEPQPSKTISSCWYVSNGQSLCI